MYNVNLNDTIEKFERYKVTECIVQSSVESE